MDALTNTRAPKVDGRVMIYNRTMPFFLTVEIQVKLHPSIILAHMIKLSMFKKKQGIRRE